MLLGGSPVTSQIPPCSQPQSQALQRWDTSTRLSGQQNQPPKAQALHYIFTSMTSCYIFHTVPASLSKRVVFLYFPYPPPAHSLGALHAHVLLSCVEHRLVSSQMLSGKAQRSQRLLGYLLSQPLSSQADIIAFVTVRNRARGELELLGASQFQHQSQMPKTLCRAPRLPGLSKSPN